MAEKPPERPSRGASGYPSEEAALQRCRRLQASHPDRSTHQWLPRRSGDGWQIVKIAVPPPVQDLIAETQASERPPTADDPRVPQVKNIGPHVGPI